jgi:hypothetical protein
MNFLKLLKKPDASLPLAMSLIALALVVLQIAIYGTAHEPDEGAAAHIFQALMVAQFPIVLLFALRFIAKDPKNSIAVIALQMGAALLALAPVWWFRL